MQFFVIIKNLISGFPNNIPLALCCIFLYFFVSYLSYQLSWLLYKSSQHSKYTIILPLFLTVLWLYGELRSGGIIIYSYDTTGFLYSTSSFLGTLIVLLSTAALFGNLFFWLGHHKMKR